MSNYEIERRKLIATASQYVLDAMQKFTTDHDGLTPLEWIKVASDSAMTTALKDGLAEEWREQ